MAWWWITAGCERDPGRTDPGEPAPIEVREVGLLQGSGAVAWRDGRPAEPGVRLVADRETRVRVVLDGDGATRVELVERTAEGERAWPAVSEDGESFLARWSARPGATLEVRVDGAPATAPIAPAIVEGDDLVLVLVPVRYRADGSDRVPDVGEDRVAGLASVLASIWPVRSVVVRVDPPLDWDGAVEPDGDGWHPLLEELVARRRAAEEAPNTYHYGLVDPAPSLAAYCAEGCVEGHSLVPATVDDPGERAAVGIGYSGLASTETLLHELGHAHGRGHAPCGLGARPADPDYPHADATLGADGWDARTDDLVAADDHADLMSWCSPIWVSDYTWEGLLQRTIEVRDAGR